MTEPEEQPAGGPAASPKASTATEPRRLHGLTPFARLWGVIAVLAFVLVRDQGAQEVSTTSVLISVGVVVAVGLVALGAGYVAWARTSFWFDDDGDFRIASGLFEIRERRVQVSRLQAVDVVRPLVARALGLAELRIDVAGGKDSKVKLAYLGQEDAERLRADLLARSAGVEHDREQGPVPDAPESLLATVPTDQLIRSVLLGTSGLVGIVAVLSVVVVFAITREPGVLVTMLFAVAAPIAIAFKEFSVHFNFQLAESPDGLRTRHGLIETRAQTVPPGRVQAVGLSQPLLWRRPGWVRIHVVVAGYSASADEPGTTVLMPVVPEDVALALLARVLPGFDPRAVELTPVPRRARWRAPIQAPRYAAGLGDAVMVSKYGRLTRQTAVVPYARVQSVRLVQGPAQRRLQIATVDIDTTSGPVHLRAPERDEHEARAWAEAISVRALAARGADTSERWMRPRQ